MKPRSLRMQLAVFGFAAIAVPVVVLLGVVFATVEESEVDDEVASLTADGQVTVESERTFDVSTTPDVSPWVPLTAVLLAIPAALVVWVWSGRAVRPIREITAVANQIQAGSLDQRIGLGDAPAEVQALGDSFDQMLDRLSEASTTQQQLIEDANHELRTPLAALAINAEVLLNAQDPTPDEYQASAQRTDALARRMQLTIDELLVNARSRHLRIRQVDNDLADVVRRVVEQQATLTPHRRVTWSGPATLPLGIDGPSVERAVRNLVDNAVRYSPDGSSVDVKLAQAGDVVTVAVTDEGPGIAVQDRSQIFDRYFRADHGLGTDGDEGEGIGLAIVKQVADAHGGVEVESPVANGKGSRFTLTFNA